jgi:hypothetical protein
VRREGVGRLVLTGLLIAQVVGVLVSLVNSAPASSSGSSTVGDNAQ